MKHRQDVERVLLESQYPLYISLAFVHHNCPRQFSRVEDLASMAETLSDCDMFQPHMYVMHFILFSSSMRESIREQLSASKLNAQVRMILSLELTGGTIQHRWFFPDDILPPYSATASP